MRRLADRARIEAFMRALAAESESPARVYFTGGVTAVLRGWRASTIGLDVLIVPEQDGLLRAISRIKESLEVNVDLACPADFIPVVPGWEERSPFIVQGGRLSFHHYDPHAQALAKIERGHAQDRADVEEMIRRGLVEPAKLLAFFDQVEPAMYRYPSLDPRSFRRAVEQITGRPGPGRAPG